MATQRPSSSSSCLKIIIGSSSNPSTSEESSASYVTNSTNVTPDDASSVGQRDSSVSSVAQVLTIGDTNMEDVLPTYVLQPKEIFKNIDLMKTVAMLMETKLQQPPKGTDSEKMRDLYSDIQRFPEAYQKFTSIIHQIQYLNVTTNWDASEDLGDSKGNLFSKLLQSAKFNSESEHDVRKRMLLNLVNDVLRVFSRYQAIQVSLEERLKNFNDFIVKKSIQQHRVSETDSVAPAIVTPADFSDEDDPQQPLLNKVGGTAADRKVFADFVQKIEALSEILRRGRRQAGEVQDSIDVLRDLINWDHKQMTSGGHTRDCNNDESYQESSGQLPEIVVSQRNSRNDACCQNQRSRRQNFKAWIITAVVIAVLVLLLITTAALSFLKFNY